MADCVIENLVDEYRDCGNYEMVNHPDHYNKYDVEVIDMIERIWGEAACALWSEITAFKYRMRLGEKPENPISQDLAKEEFYINAFNERTENGRLKISCHFD